MDKRTQILNAAESILAQHGFYAFSMHHLAETAGVAAGTIYRYFENKEALMDALQVFIRKEAANDVFTGWQDSFTAKQKYDLMWNNVFDAVLANPKRLIVIEMLHCVPNINQAQITLLDDIAFKRLIDFYQQGITTARFLDWQLLALMAVSFDTSINLAKRIIRNELTFDQQQLDQVREASWAIIQNPNFNQQD
ncbi:MULTISPECIES: TetR/AcrR family transcriptional regulator [Psychromonas]|uniref:TetR/AcrR family transcriptional regulator n=1 Tax=Psychromonas TaxID=67572 RepID=UPI000403FABA|nr:MULTISPECIES: TetR/AcrR family transcriptional regulator [Psychromonas]MBB1271455.1 TetR/AcrR family transcriptional regulator [Psychromonas sp. SR45-3]